MVFEKLGAPIFRKGALEKMTATKKRQSKEGTLDHLYSIQKKKGEWSESKNPRWQPIGTKKNDGHGYILIKIAEGNGFKNWIQEHVYNVEQEIGRKIDLKIECVHHINGIKYDNRIENLFLTTQEYHRKLHQSIFMDTIKELLDKKIVYFDRNEKKYKVRKDFQITFSS